VEVQVNPLEAFLRRQGVMVLDGGLATALEARGFDLSDELWSATVLLEAPEAIRRVHLDFLAAGADCITTASYQASLEGFRRRGLSREDGIELLRRSVALAIEARDAFWSEPANRESRLRPLVAASVGPYGAFLADGSEYLGRYRISDEKLTEFHRERWHVLAQSPADLLACETLPSAREAAVLLQLLDATPERWAWFSFSCRDDAHLCDGSPLVEAVRACDAHPRVAAVGINCTAPSHIAALIREARRGTEKPVIVYPNSGETYDPARHTWVAAPAGLDWGNSAAEWARLGAAGIGGCCRVGAEEIAGMRRRLLA